VGTLSAHAACYHVGSSSVCGVSTRSVEQYEQADDAMKVKDGHAADVCESVR
jgi:hypothetical protein